MNEESNSEISERNDSQSETKDPNKTKIFVHGLHPYTTSKDLIDAFIGYCHITDLVFKKNPRTGKHNGYAFFSVPTREIAERLIKEDHLLHGRLIHCDLKHNNVEDQKKNQRRRLFIGGLPRNIKDEELTNIFKKYGKVRAAYSIKDLQGRSKNFGYVDFCDEETALNVLDLKSIRVKDKMVEVKPYVKKKKKTREGNNNSNGDSNYENNEEQINMNNQNFQPEQFNNYNNLLGPNVLGNFGFQNPYNNNFNQLFGDYGNSGVKNLSRRVNPPQPFNSSYKQQNFIEPSFNFQIYNEKPEIEMFPGLNFKNFLEVDISQERKTNIKKDVETPRSTSISLIGDMKKDFKYSSENILKFSSEQEIRKKDQDEEDYKRFELMNTGLQPKYNFLTFRELTEASLKKHSSPFKDPKYERSLIKNQDNEEELDIPFPPEKNEEKLSFDLFSDSYEVKNLDKIFRCFEMEESE